MQIRTQCRSWGSLTETTLLFPSSFLSEDYLGIIFLHAYVHFLLSGEEHYHMPVTDSEPACRRFVIQEQNSSSMYAQRSGSSQTLICSFTVVKEQERNFSQWLLKLTTIWFQKKNQTTNSWNQGIGQRESLRNMHSKGLSYSLTSCRTAAVKGILRLFCAVTAPQQEFTLSLGTKEWRLHLHHVYSTEGHKAK